MTLLFQQQLGEISHIMMILGFQSLQLGNGVLVQRSIVLSNWYLLLRLQSLSYVACFLFLCFGLMTAMSGFWSLTQSAPEKAWDWV